jgi:hypothetical protein
MAESACGQLAIMERQTVATERSAGAAVLAASTAKEALELTQCADVLIEKVTCSTDPAPLSAISAVTISVKNFGNTRAVGVTISGHLTISPLGSTSAADDAIQFPSQPAFTLGSQATNRVGFPPLVMFRDSPNTASLRTGDAALIFSIEIKYLDVFGHEHTGRSTGRRNSNGTWSIVREE